MTGGWRPKRLPECPLGQDKSAAVGWQTGQLKTRCKQSVSPNSCGVDSELLQLSFASQRPAAQRRSHRAAAGADPADGDVGVRVDGQQGCPGRRPPERRTPPIRSGSRPSSTCPGSAWASKSGSSASPTSRRWSVSTVASWMGAASASRRTAGPESDRRGADQPELVSLAQPTLGPRLIVQPNPPGRGRALESEMFGAGGWGGGGIWGTATTLKAIDQRSPSPRNGATEWGCQAGNT